MSHYKIYDIETFINVFTFAYISNDTGKEFIFEVSEYQNDWKQLRNLLTQWSNNDDISMVGFNNIGFDNPIMLKLYQTHDENAAASDIIHTAREACIKIINTPFEQRFSTLPPPWKYRWSQLDLMKVWHYDNISKATSLKALEIAMHSHNVQDLPYHPDTYLNREEIEVLKEYNMHDVRQTKKFFDISRDMIDFRETLVSTLGESVMNANDSKIGSMFFIQKLKPSFNDTLPKPTFLMGTPMNLSDFIFDYVQFDRPEFNEVLNWIKAQVITETKGVFTNLREDNLGGVAQYAEMNTKKKKFKDAPTYDDIEDFKYDHPLGVIVENKLKSGKTSFWKTWNEAKALNVKVNGLAYIFGTGGLHASVDNEVYKSTDTHMVLDLDVASYYPNLAISNNLHPEHLGSTFSTIYNDLYQERKLYAKGSAENGIYKLALNGSYGNSNNKFSPFYDPRFTMAITLNGQLLLCMLSEALLTVDGLKIIQVNTDGVSSIFKRSDYDRVKSIYTDWEKLTGLVLEESNYSEMHIRDVNNYIAKFTDGSVKLKGAYDYNVDYHQNHSALIVRKAVESHIINGDDITDFIMNHDNVFDFYLATKVPKSSRLIARVAGVDKPAQNTCRYYVSTGGAELIKVMPALKLDGNEREFQVESGWLCTTANQIEGNKPDNINYNYYIEQAIKLVADMKDGKY